MKDWLWSATIYRHVVDVKVKSTWMPGAKVSQQNIARCRLYAKLFRNAKKKLLFLFLLLHCCVNVRLDLVKVTQNLFCLLVHLPSISHPLKCAIVTIKSVLFTLPVSGFNVVADQFMILQDTFEMDLPDLKHNLWQTVTVILVFSIEVDKSCTCTAGNSCRGCYKYSCRVNRFALTWTINTDNLLNRWNCLLLFSQMKNIIKINQRSKLT